MNKLPVLLSELFFRCGYLLSIITLLVIILASLSRRRAAEHPSIICVPEYFARIAAYAAVIFFAVFRPAAPLFWPTISVHARSSGIEFLQPLVGRGVHLHDPGSDAIGVFADRIASQFLRSFLISLKNPSVQSNDR